MLDCFSVSVLCYSIANIKKYQVHNNTEELLHALSAHSTSLFALPIVLTDACSEVFCLQLTRPGFQERTTFHHSPFFFFLALLRHFRFVLHISEGIVQRNRWMRLTTSDE